MEYINKIRDKGLLRCILFAACTPFYKASIAILNKIFFKIKIYDRYIVFKSHPDYADNSKVLYEYMLKNKKAKKYIWLINHNNIKEIKKKYKNKNTMFISESSKYHKGLSLKAIYYINRSKLIFFTQGGLISSIKPKKNQLRINLWHGCGYKNAPKQKNNKKWIDNNYFDYVLVPGDVFIKTKKEFFGCEEKQVLALGYPRYDMFTKENKETEKYVNKITKNNKLILWMPTFRTTNNTKSNNGYFPEEKVYENFDMPILNSIEDVKKLNELCKNLKITLCVKRHPNQKKYSFEDSNFSNIIFIDNSSLSKENIDLYSLLKYTDGLITDYSSVAIDYLLLNKPIAFTLDDFEEYSKTRGFVFKDPKKYMPGHHIYNFEDMKKYIEDVGKDKDLYKEDRQAIMNDVHNPCDNYCERIVNKIEDIMEEN